MVKNVSTPDRVARIFVAALLAFLAFTTSVQGWGETISYIVAAYLLVTSVIGFDPIYKALDINSYDHGGTYHSGEDPFDGRGGN